MRKCPGCGFNNTDDRERCLRCSTKLIPDAVPDPGVSDARTPGVFSELLIWLRRANYTLGNKLGGNLPTGLSHRFPWTAAYLSLLLGAGQAYNHQFVKAGIFAFVQFVSLAFLLLTFFQPWNNWVLLGVLFWLFYMMADGFISAARINGDPWRWRHVVAMWFAFMFFVTGSFFIFNAVTQRAVRLTWVVHDTLAPQLRQGDKVVVTNPFFSPDFRPGMVVYYNPDRYVVRKPGQGDFGMEEIVSINEQSSFGVITAMPGQRLSWENEGHIMVDGEPVPPNLLPVNPFGYPGSFDMVVPDGHFGIIMSHGAMDRVTGSIGTPRQAVHRRYILNYYDEVVMVPEENIFGMVLLKYQPPESRRWYGASGGLWTEYPEDYPVQE